MPDAARDFLRKTFDDVAELYDRVRPHYPEALFDDLVALAGLEPGSPLPSSRSRRPTRRSVKRDPARPGPRLPEEAPDESDEILASGHFDRVETRRYVWEVTYTAQEYIDLLDTFSGHIAMARAKRRYLEDEVRRLVSNRPEGTIRRHWLAILHVARRPTS